MVSVACNVYKALQLLEWLAIDKEASPETRMLTSSNHGDLYHHGEAISSAVTESSINQIISRRFMKKQQMR